MSGAWGVELSRTNLGSAAWEAELTRTNLGSDAWEAELSRTNLGSDAWDRDVAKQFGKYISYEKNSFTRSLGSTFVEETWGPKSGKQI